MLTFNSIFNPDTMNRVVVGFPQLVAQRVKPANGTISLHVTNRVPERGFDTGASHSMSRIHKTLVMVVNLSKLVTWMKPTS